jgi:hypothetical protein
LDAPRQFRRKPAVEYLLRFLAVERLDHVRSITLSINNVKR